MRTLLQYPYEINVHSDLYGKTTCVIDIESFLQGREIFPCGDGCDYKLTKSQIREIKKHIREVDSI